MIFFYYRSTETNSREYVCAECSSHSYELMTSLGAVRFDSTNMYYYALSLMLDIYLYNEKRNACVFNEILFFWREISVATLVKIAY